ncbi:aspartyl protease family protein [Salibacterium aidingense]|uniref:aspartyl protease family protein n=1 Tax=Salibacterium aidingense TaxID=384933 RepID=UPI0006868006|nr:aspartyl protease family protein [Salibacterium aidingense]
MADSLPVVSMVLDYNGFRKRCHRVLIDTGCAATIVDTDLAEEIGFLLDLEGAVLRKMYGVGGTEICIEQIVPRITFDRFELTDFVMQLGDIRNLYGFDAIIGNDFLLYHKLVVDFDHMWVGPR